VPHDWAADEMARLHMAIGLRGNATPAQWEQVASLRAVSFLPCHFRAPLPISPHKANGSVRLTPPAVAPGGGDRRRRADGRGVPEGLPALGGPHDRPRLVDR
jgi:hypothetical protein